VTPYARGAGEVTGVESPAGPRPWYRRPDVWFLVGVVLLPFGWLLGLCRVAWIAFQARRRQRAHAQSRVSRRGAPVARAVASVSVPPSSPAA